MEQLMGWADYQERRNRWVEHNFPTDPDTSLMHSAMGVVEEIGELTHHHLKQEQAIRGDDDHHVREAMDAVGDTTVYLWGITNHFHVAFDQEFWETVDAARTNTRSTHNTALGLLQLAAFVGDLARRVHENQKGLGGSGPRWLCARVVGGLWGYCDIRGWIYSKIIEDTWTTVEQRDWQKNPQDGS